jgi:hypothetical protein
MQSDITRAVANSGKQFGQFDEVEMMFIEEELSLHGEFLSDLFVESIENMRLRKTDELIDNISFHTSISKGNKPKLTFSFPSHGRLIEVNYFKKAQRSIFEAIDTDKVVWGLNHAKKARKKKKDTRWYTRNVYGSINRLLSRLATNYSEAEIARLKLIIERTSLRNSSKVTINI